MSLGFPMGGYVRNSITMPSPLPPGELWVGNATARVTACAPLAVQLSFSPCLVA